jgi:N-glycosylase/DNA lyase
MNFIPRPTRKEKSLRNFKSENGNILVECPGFDLETTLNCGQSFRRHVDCEQLPDGRVILKNISEDEFLTKWDIYFDFNRDYETIKSEFISDTTLAKAIDFCGGIRILKQDSWEALISFIISQNNNIPRIKLIIDRFITHFGHFPTPQDLLSDISFAKTGFREKYLKSAAMSNIDLEAVEKMPTENVRQELMKIKGVGPKVAECTLLYGFGRLECFPRDVWINRVLKEFYPDGFPYINHPYAGVAQQFLFHYIRNLKQCEKVS